MSYGRHHFLAFSGALLLAGVVIASWLLWEIQREMHQPSALSATRHYTVREGASLRQVAEDLADLGAIREPHYWMLAAYWHGWQGAIQAGEYQLLPGVLPLTVLERMARGEVHQHPIRFEEGRTFQEILDRLSAHPRLVPTLVGLEQGEIMALLGRPKSAAEGMFAPDTYFFPAGTTDLAILRVALTRMEAILEQAWRGRMPDLPYATPYEALIMASIIEREAQVEDERSRIAGVFVRRLRLGMRLQADPTVQYARDRHYRRGLRRRHLREVDSPFNTYLHAGLPPTPIALPSAASIHGALHPQSGDALYFVAMGNGRHHFSATLEEHNRAVARVRAQQR